MSDFRDLMIAQMDDAAAAFAAEDFAAGYGRGVVGRVRRRRTVRAVGVGGVSAMAVGALALGGTQLLGDGVQPANPASSQCVLSASAAPLWLEGASQTLSVSWHDNELEFNALAGNGTARVVVDGEFVWDMRAGQDAAPLTPDADGRYTVSLSDGRSMWFELRENDATHRQVAFAFDGEEGMVVGTERQVTEWSGPCPPAGPSPVYDPPTVSPTGTAEAYGASSPFQCGFDFPASESANDRLSVVGRVASADQIRAEFDRRFGNQSPTTEVGADDGVWATTTGMPASAGRSVATLSVYDPSDPSAGGRMTLSGEPGAYQFLPEAVSFVGVRDGAVVATVVPGYDGATPGMVLDRTTADAEVDAFLLGRSALTACDASVGDLDIVDLYAVAGYDDDHGLTYAWSEVSAP